MNILNKADQIVNKRSEEKIREYGPFSECNRRAAVIASILSNKNISIEDMYNMQIALKLARESWSHKEDNLLDCCAFIGAKNNYLEGISVNNKDVTKKND
jgi:hypothetical protein